MHQTNGGEIKVTWRAQEDLDFVSTILNGLYRSSHLLETCWLICGTGKASNRRLGGARGRPTR